MIQIHKYRLHGKFLKSFCSRLFAELKTKFTPLISTVKREYWTRLGLPAGDEAHEPASGTTCAGEIYLSKSADFLYVSFSENLDSLECGAIERESEPGEFAPFFETVRTLVEQESEPRNHRWEALTHQEKFEALASKQSSPKPSKQENSAAKALVDPNLHRLLSRVQNASSSLLRDLAASEDRPGLESLVQLGLVSKDFAVLCKEKGQQIIKVNSRQAIAETSEKGIKCFLCGKSISEESVEEILSITELGKNMIEKNHWMPILVLDLLAKHGAKNRISMDEDEFQTIYFQAFGEIVQISLLDHKPTISDALVINAKLSLSESQTGIIVGINGISPVMSELITHSNPNCALHFLESMSSLEENLEPILKVREQEKVKEVVAPFVALTSVSLGDLVCQRIFPDDDSKRHAPSVPKKARPPREEPRIEKPLEAVRAPERA